MNFDTARFNMIEQQIRPWNVLDANVLELLQLVKREDFVPAAYQSLAFADLEIPLAYGQSMLAPRLQARLVQDLLLQPNETVLEIGTGSGYMAALMANLAADVVSVELVPELAATARENLARAGIHNVDVRVGDGSKGAVSGGPFDAIVLSGSVAEIPSGLLDLLKVGGRLIAVVGDEPIMHATLVKRTGAEQFHTTTPWDASAARLQNFAEPSRFVL